MAPDLLRCKRCGYMLIAEVYGTHNCKRVVDYKIEGNILWLNDGDKWYPRKLMSPTRNQHDFKHGDGSTEPKIVFKLARIEKINGIYCVLF